MRIYNLLQDFAPGDSESDSISVSPDWVIAIIKQKYPLTYNRASASSFGDYFPDAVDTRGNTLIIHGDCFSLQVSNNKSSHLYQLSASLYQGEVNYLSEIMPGDYMAAWMVNDTNTLKNLIDRIRAGEACNHFMDGLKFFGKVVNVQKNLNQDPGGIRSVKYSLSGVGFSEFDASLFYNEHLSENIPGIGKYFGRIGAAFNKLIDGEGKDTTIDVNKAIPFFVDMLLGTGVPPNLGRGNTDPMLKATAGLEGPYSYILPKAFGALVGKTKSSKPDGAVLAAADILELQYGVQHFTRDVEDDFSQDERQDINDFKRGMVFCPDGPRVGPRRFTRIKMMGSFVPQQPQFTNCTVWSVLHQYLNPAVNEIFTCLRANGEGQVVPTLVLRQLPFSSGRAKVPFEVTKFLDLPRWKIPSILVRSVQLGRSDSLRLNWVHVLGVSPGAVGRDDLANQTVRNPPFRDDLDIARSGLRNYSSKVNCSFADVSDNAKTDKIGATAATNWMRLLADILMGQHLTLTGSMSIQGIQAPICIGDNIEWDGVVLHIESVNHSCSIQPSGQKTFATSLTLTHGVRADPGQDDIGLYAGIKDSDQMRYNPGETSEEEPLGNKHEEPKGGVQTFEGLDLRESKDDQWWLKKE